MTTPYADESGAGLGADRDVADDLGWLTTACPRVSSPG